MTIDFLKGFDYIEHSSIFATLKYFNFGENFSQWVKLFFTDFYIQTQNFGELSTPFLKERGTNQGCNLSPFCFLLCAEIMARKLKQNDTIKGIDVEGTRCLISQFADDTTLFLSYDQKTLEAVIKTFAEIAKSIGLTINYDKTVIYRIGSLANTNTKIYTTKEFNSRFSQTSWNTRMTILSTLF